MCAPGLSLDALGEGGKKGKKAAGQLRGNKRAAEGIKKLFSGGRPRQRGNRGGQRARIENSKTERLTVKGSKLYSTVKKEDAKKSFEEAQKRAQNVGKAR